MDSIMISGIGLVIVTATLSVFGSIAVYLLGRSVRDENVMARSKNEVAQAVYSVILLIVILGLINITGSLFDSLVPALDVYSTPNSPFSSYVSSTVSYRDLGVALNTTGSNVTCLYHAGNYYYPSHICVAMAYLDRAEWLVTNTMYYIMELREFVGIIQSTELKFRVRNIGITATLLDALEFEENIITNMYNILSKELLIYKMLKFSLNLLSQVLFTALLTSGLVLRSFYFTRKLGGLLIASALALYYAGPFVLILGHRAIYETNNFIAIEESTGSSKVVPYMDRWKELYEPLSSSSSGSLDSSNIDEGNIFTQIKDYTTFFFRGFRRFFEVGWNYVKGSVTNKGGYLLGENGLVHMVARITMLTLVVLLIALFAVLATIKALSPLFGGDVQIAGLSYFL